MSPEKNCPDCEPTPPPPSFAGGMNRRDFVRVVSLSAAAAALPGLSHAEEPAKPKPEALVKALYDSLTMPQREEICFAWDHTDDRGLLRTHVSNNWNVVDEKQFNISGKFFTKDQQEIIRAIFLGLYNPKWHDRIEKQLRDDAGGYGLHQTIALFGEPGTGKFEFLMTGRHCTIRCDGDSSEHVAFGGPIFYGHAASGFNEQVGHPDNVYWPLAQKANGLFKMLDGTQREKALILTAPGESQVAFRGKGGEIPGLAVGELSSDQKEFAQKVLLSLLEPYRTSDQDEVLQALKAQGGLDQCRLSYYRQNSKGESVDLGDDGEWDVWRLEGPAFVWHFRGVPHVHVWVNVADDPSVKLNARG